MNLDKLRRIARIYYSRDEIKKALFEQAKGHEFIAQYGESFGKRPDTLEYENDLQGFIQNGALSFHVSEEIWSNPLELSTALTQQKLNELRTGWNLILDIDGYLEYSKIAAFLIIEALYFHGIKNIGLKFSGKKGWHIGIPFAAFPEKIKDIEIRTFFPEGPRIIAAYLGEMIKKPLAERILELSTIKEMAEAIGKPAESLQDESGFNPFSVVGIDTILIAPRHLYRAAYSLNEKSMLASIVIKPDQIKAFHPNWAKPERVFPKPFLPVPEKDEAKELMLQSLDWFARKKQQVVIKKPRDNIKVEIDKTKLNENLPPCISNIMSGIKSDGRKRSLFILINFYRSLGIMNEELEKILSEWNKKNYLPLRESYIKTQLNWFKRQAPRLPPNCKQYYQDLTVCNPDFLCNKIKNPVSYTIRKLRSKEFQKTTKRKTRSKKD